MLTRTPVPASSMAADFRDAFHGVLAADIHRRGRATDFAVRRQKFGLSAELAQFSG